MLLSIYGLDVRMISPRFLLSYSKTLGKHLRSTKPLRKELKPTIEPQRELQPTEELRRERKPSKDVRRDLNRNQKQGEATRKKLTSPPPSPKPKKHDE